MLDTNIIVRAVLGSRVGRILERSQEGLLHTPQLCLEETRSHTPKICQKRRFDTARFLERLTVIERKLNAIAENVYSQREEEARARVPRDSEDWPTVATAFALDLPIWTEDRDFFGCGIATWITNTIEIYLAA